MSLETAALTAVVPPLRRRGGLVFRRRRTDDARHVEVVASARALALFERFDRAVAALVDEAVERLSIRDVAALAEAVPALERLRDVLAELRREAHAEEHAL